MTKQVSIQLDEESQRQIAWLSKMEIAGGKTSAILRHALRELYRTERNRIRTFYITGRSGSVLELSDGRYADTVSGDTSEDTDAHEALEELSSEIDTWDDSSLPLLTEMSLAELEAYVGQ